MKKAALILGIIFLVLTFVGGGYVLMVLVNKYVGIASQHY